jgi:hypothetical protein
LQTRKMCNGATMKIYATLGICIAALIVVGVMIAGTGGAEAEKGARKISSEVYEALENEEKVRVYVRLNEPEVNRLDEHRLTTESEDYSKLSIETKRNLMRAEILSEIKPERLIPQTGGNFFTELTEAEIEALSTDTRIASIEREKTRYIFLQDSRVQANATRTAALVESNLNLTGIGQTVCVIDSGANYSHSDLGGCYGNNSASSTCKVLGGYDFTNSDNDPMDDNGHGTHVAGIIAANGSINGVAPGAKLIIIKACNSAGSCSDSNIAAGINWCAGNASTYNISVISMSLGSNLSTGYCNNDPLASNIQNAVSKNISVVIATGNGLNNDGNGNSTAIAAPACVENVTAVGAVSKQDAITSYSNQFSLMRLLAPGGLSTNAATRINATCITSDSTSGYCGKQGTSMAAPHVAGAIAIMREYINATAQKKTPQQIEAILNNTGKRITNSATGLNYSRINIYEAIVSLDATAPNVSLVSPENATSSLNINQTFRCNATDLALRNATLYVWNASSSILNQSMLTTSGAAVALEFNASNLSRGVHQWNCLFVDENNNAVFAAPNRTITIADLTTTLAAPTSDITVNTNQTLSCNATTTANLSNSTLYVWNASGSIINTSVQNTSGSANTTNFSYNFLNESVHVWNCLFVTGTNLQQFANSNSSITYDVTRPRVNVTTPANNSWQNKGNFNTTLNENGTCLASFTGGIVNVTLSSTDNRIFNGSNATLVHGTNYTVFYYCNDSAGNLNVSTRQSFTVDLTAPNVTLLNPNNSYNLTASSTSVVFNYSVADELNISSCSLILDGATDQTNSSITNKSANHSFTKSLNAAAYTWSVNCTDEAGNVGNSSARTITISAPASSSSSGGGGGGGGGSGGAALISGTTYRPTLSDVQQGYTRALKSKDKITVAIPTTSGGGSVGAVSGGSGNATTVEHTVTVENVTDTKAYFIIRSDPVNVTLGIGESTKLNLTSPAYYDLFVKLESIFNKTANVTVKVINESFVINTTALETTNKTNGTIASNNISGNQTGKVENKESVGKRTWIIYLIAGIVLVLMAAIGAYLYWYWQNQQKNTEDNKPPQNPVNSL